MEKSNYQTISNEIESKLFSYVKKFSFPRLAGTTGENKSVSQTIKTFEELGFTEQQILKQPFNFSTFYSEELIKIIGFLNIAIILILLLMKYLYPFLVIITIGIVTLTFFSMLKVLRHPEYRGFWEKHFGSYISATNVITKVPSKNNNNSSNLIISAHLDSKSQTFKTVWRVIFISLWEIGIILFIVFFAFFLIDLYFNIFKPILLFLEICTISTSIITILSIIMVFTIKTSNFSPGSLDNASGMSLVFELSSYFKANPLNNYNIWFCQFSAEEIGTMGSRVFLDLFEQELLNNRIYQINFDMVSCKNSEDRVEYIKSYGIIPKKKSSPLLISILDKIVQEEKIQIKGHTLLSGAHTDSLPFHLLNLETIDFSTPFASKYSHTKRDQPDKVNTHVLLNTFITVKKLVLRLDNIFDH